MRCLLPGPSDMMLSARMWTGHCAWLESCWKGGSKTPKLRPVAVVVQASSRKARRKNVGGGPGTQGSVAPTQDVAQLPTEPGTTGQQLAEQEATLAAAAEVPRQRASEAGPAALPTVSRGRVFIACAQVSGLLAAGGLGLRAAAPYISPALRDGQEEAVRSLLQWPGGMTVSDVGLALAVSGAVTAARALLLQVWPDFKAATDRSNQQALGPLQPLDLLWVSALPGVAEELLFRGALVPAIYPDWRGVLIAGAAFGVLHNSGGRNPAFALWAGMVGSAYGILFLSTQNVYSPMLAHSVANLASAAYWLWTRDTLHETQHKL